MNHKQRLDALEREARRIAHQQRETQPGRVFERVQSLLAEWWPVPPTKQNAGEQQAAAAAIMRGEP